MNSGIFGPGVVGILGGREKNAPFAARSKVAENLHIILAKKGLNLAGREGEGLGN
ncbi:MAG: hypothetical protein L0196_08425 [candidate division Zixibacteria bacterium]|nr:hypothetical protein [candidate division Zixibacteria bacterium]